MIDYFVPADATPRLPLLGDLLPRLPMSVARAYVDAYAPPDGVVIDPFCIGTSVIRAAIESGRRVIAASFNPAAIRSIEATLWPIDARAAFTHLADTPKGDRRLRDHILALYATRCPTCGAEAVAHAFTWDRDANAPVYKLVDCARCGLNGGPTDESDATAARRHEPRGLPFWLLHNKVIPRDRADEEDIARVSDALDAYTSRALAALADILLKFDGLSPEDRDALRAPLIGLFDAASSLHPADEEGRPVQPRPKPRSLRPPAYFIECNAWLALESQFSNLQSPHDLTPRASSLDALLGDRSPAACLLTEPSRDLGKRLPPGSIDLLLAHPPLPDPTWWTLSAVWAGWLWGRVDAMASLLQILSQRRTNWDWQWRAIASALGAIFPALKDDARAALVFSAEDAPGEAALDGVALAVAGSGGAISRVLCDPFSGYRLHARPNIHPPGDRDREALAQDIALAATEAAIKTLRARGEPAAWPIVRAAIIEALTQDGALTVAARLPEDGPQPLAFVRDAIEAALSVEGGPLLAVDDRMLWLADASRAAEPLADRVEAAVRECLRAQVDWDELALLTEIYRRFPGELTPENPLIAACIESYAEESEAHRVRLRAEDRPEARQAELQSMGQALDRLGEQLGYTVEVRGQVVIWKEADKTAYVLAISATAEAEAMRRAGQASSGMPVLVIPGGRATLLQHKLARDARLRQAVERGGWQFLKFGAVRAMIAHPGMDRRAFSLALGLDPPLEKPQAQIPLL